MANHVKPNYTVTLNVFILLACQFGPNIARCYTIGNHILVVNWLSEAVLAASAVLVEDEEAGFAINVFVKFF